MKDISREMAQWQGLSVQPHRFGGIEWVLGKREIGHIHGDVVVDAPLPKRVRDELIVSGEAEAHHVLPESGWVSIWLRRSTDVARALRVLRRSYELAFEQKERMAAL